MGAHHDGEGNFCFTFDGDNFIMNSGYDEHHPLFNNDEFMFSTCSAKYFKNHVDNLLNTGSAESKKCLLDKLQPSSVPDISGEMPGQLYDPDTQCKMAFGEKSYFLTGKSVLSLICNRMYCHDDTQLSSQSLLNAVDGTSCGNKTWCVAGQCVSSDQSHEGNEAPSTTPAMNPVATTVVHISPKLRSADGPNKPDNADGGKLSTIRKRPLHGQSQAVSTLTGTDYYTFRDKSFKMKTKLKIVLFNVVQVQRWIY
ncbi:A disintegrin and metalloproteinase with thrombospondin motifs 18-like [Haliotis cracherodii]|uniref:A disintegrin and metalloproteinase with thrombospondin motifs 18-like n=1 Tax=Haliotis cracherodii TaxID=6455 RepID=UPI0039E84A6A